MNFTSIRAAPQLKQRWRQQIASQMRRRAQEARPLVAITQLIRGRVEDGLIDVRHLTWVSLHDQIQADGALVIRCAGYSATSLPWGLHIGGADGCRFDKDLALAPAAEAKGRRFDSSDRELLSLSLDLDHLLERRSRFPHLPCRQQPRWPRLWAALAPSSQVDLAGPEFDADHGRTGQPIASSVARSAAGLTLFPLEYVSHAWRHFLAIYADLTTIPKRQVIALDAKARSLHGHEGAVAFDLVSSRFTTTAAGRRRKTARKPTAALLAS